jgi:hypothetical protein
MYSVTKTLYDCPDPISSDDYWWMAADLLAGKERRHFKDSLQHFLWSVIYP